MGIRCALSCLSTSATLNCLCSGCRTSAHSARPRSTTQALSSVNEPKRFLPASIQMRRRLSCTFFSTTPFSQPLALGVAARCDPCIRHHAHALAKLGASRQELDEPLGVVVYMSDGPTRTHAANAIAANAIAAFDEFSSKAPA